MDVLALVVKVSSAASVIEPALHAHVDVGGGGQFDVHRREFGPAGGAFDRHDGYLDVAQHRIGDRDRVDLLLGHVEVAASGVDLGQPSREPIGLVAVGQPVERRAGGVGLGLRLLQCRSGLFGGRRGDVVDVTSDGLLPAGVCCAAVQLGDGADAVLDLGVEPLALGHRRGRMRRRWPSPLTI